MGRNVQKTVRNWKFFRGEESGAWYKGFDDSGWLDVDIPHDWSVAEPFSRRYSSGTGYLPGGIGWYRKTFFLPEEARGKKVYITFEGVYNNAQVWCNSYYLGKRPYGYSSFIYDISDFVSFGEERNVVAVRVNHRDIADSRWYAGSGIYRDVYVTVTEHIHFDNYGIFITTPEVSREQAAINVSARLSNESVEAAQVCIKAYLIDKEGNTVAEALITRSLEAGGSDEADLQLRITQPRLWSTETPYLYTAVTEIIEEGVSKDLVKTPVGIRWFEFSPSRGFSLNGAGMKIKGVCVHHDAGCLGAAVPEKVWSRRLGYLKEMGCNAIRTSHNPPAPCLLDLCDEMGFLVIDEAFDEWEGAKNKWTTGHNVYPPVHYGYYEDFPQWGETDIMDMVLRDRNHPSVIMWSIGNEIDYPNDPYCHPAFLVMTGNNDAEKPASERLYDPNRPNAERLVTIAGRLVRRVKECDTTRPVTAAAAFPELSNLTGYTALLDAVGYNYKENLYEKDHLKYPGMIIYGSENTADFDAWLAVRDSEYICAQFVWTGIDFMGEARGWPVRISRSGFLDLAGFRKPGYYYRQSLWTSKPMAYLTSRRKRDNAAAGIQGEASEPRAPDTGEPHWNWSKGDKVEVVCFTNCEEAELFINGRSAGTRTLKDYPQRYMVWEMDYEPGKLEVFAHIGNSGNNANHGNNAKYCCCCELHTAGVPKKLSMRSDAGELRQNGTGIAHIEIRVLDASDREVYQADNLICLAMDGSGEILGLENGDASDLEPYCSRRRKAYHGRLLAYVRINDTAESLVVEAEASGLEPGYLELVSK